MELNEYVRLRRELILRSETDKNRLAEFSIIDLIPHDEDFVNILKIFTPYKKLTTDLNYFDTFPID